MELMDNTYCKHLLHLIVSYIITIMLNAYSYIRVFKRTVVEGFILLASYYCIFIQEHTPVWTSKQAENRKQHCCNLSFKLAYGLYISLLFTPSQTTKYDCSIETSKFFALQLVWSYFIIFIAHHYNPMINSKMLCTCGRTINYKIL